MHLKAFPRNIIIIGGEIPLIIFGSKQSNLNQSYEIFTESNTENVWRVSGHQWCGYGLVLYIDMDKPHLQT